MNYSVKKQISKGKSRYYFDKAKKSYCCTQCHHQLATEIGSLTLRAIEEMQERVQRPLNLQEKEAVLWRFVSKLEAAVEHHVQTCQGLETAPAVAERPPRAPRMRQPAMSAAPAMPSVAQFLEAPVRAANPNLGTQTVLQRSEV